MNYMNNILISLKPYYDRVYNKYLFKSEYRKEMKKEVESIYSDFDNVILKLLNPNYETSIPRKVELTQASGKKRYVYLHTLEERMFLSLLYMYFSDKYDYKVSDNCFSYKKDICTLDAIKSINKDVKRRVNSYCFKVDVSSYFDNVSLEILENVFDDIFRYEPEPIPNFIKKIYFKNKYIWKGEICEQYLSLIQGCSFASFLANIILRELDDEMVSKCKNLYARYSDDIIVFCNEKDEIQNHVKRIEDHLYKLGLKLNPKKIEYFQPKDEIDYLGLKLLPNGDIDMSDESLRKMKKKIKSLFRKYRLKIEKNNMKPKVAVKKMCKEFNKQLYLPYIKNPNKFGWAYYMFRYINRVDSLRILDFYLKDTLRYLYTGKHQKSNYYKLTTEELYELGYTSIVEMYLNFKYDFDYYYAVCYNM